MILVIKNVLNLQIITSQKTNYLFFNTYVNLSLQWDLVFNLTKSLHNF